MYRPKQHNAGYLSQVTLVLITLIRPIHGLLLFPTTTALQVTSSISIPADLNVRTKVFIDLGFQMNYNLPYALSSFYNTSIWADELARREKRQLDNNYYTNLQQIELESGLHPADFTAGQLYAGLEKVLESYGFHRSCLLRSVCELALHPFAEDHFYGMVTQVITFLLTPSQHEGFAENEHLYRERYEKAEQIGFLGGQCHLTYPNCEIDIINLATRLVR
ncbi:uncharacterized protein LOC108116576 [Drosophila eugracilis]|uniref:uncharacterized protein LOC108116576 n=1 Tax=Drosophila eugracilis TaxID=29029 RepID=UPI0007E63076|nr:uncharacterized protein LOC108116576 [Drosophila eugracilis]